MAAASDRDLRLGLLAFGDSITNGGGERQLGVAPQSWALWVARGLGLAFTNYAFDGARAGDVVHQQIPAFERLTAHPAARYELGCLYIGVNDVRALDWDAAGFEATFRSALGFLVERCDRALAVTAPLDLGRPRATKKVRGLNAVVQRAAQDLGALTLDLSSFSARNLVMPDHVHPTALGQVAIAERALDVLSADGVTVAIRPSLLIYHGTSRLRRLYGDVTYCYRRARQSLIGIRDGLLLRLPRARAGRVSN